MIDEKVAGMQVRFADISEEDVVLEVGPGLGILTALLAEKAKKVVAIEQDRRLFGHLKTRKLKNTELVNADALKIDFPRFDKIVSNLPYQISSPITFKFLERDFSSAVLMYQKEFAERLAARRGRDSSRLSIKLNYKSEIRLLGYVPRSAFYPVPEVDSAIVMLKPREPSFKVESEAHFFKLVDCIYAHRRKKIYNCLLEHWQDFSKTKTEMKSLLQGLPFTERRAEELEPKEMAELSNLIYMGFPKD